jgi:hypothetical protein
MRARLPAWLVPLALLGCGTPTLEAQGTLSIVDVSPTDGAIDVPVDAAQTVCFSQPVAAADASVSKFWVEDQNAQKAPELQVGLAGDGACVRIAHAALAAGVQHLVHVEKGVRAAQGAAALPVGLDSRFQTAAQ